MGDTSGLRPFSPHSGIRESAGGFPHQAAGRRSLDSRFRSRGLIGQEGEPPTGRLRRGSRQRTTKARVHAGTAMGKPARLYLIKPFAPPTHDPIWSMAFTFALPVNWDE